ncbi:DUF4349 domain-containing protein [Paludisphaera mucosa]|uniref:DUF4349 domain-containing protein n=1 Tax=Paludisphaera mucosa TaxID=3030827 RepID=A0ABT6FIM8_9BACT|nr:DUF4349 domain-containing protein [Paludisphaera mucosa]MDG3007431.1 DUF4349 domain-containing protein [Paludisphaera mucosa]
MRALTTTLLTLAYLPLTGCGEGIVATTASRTFAAPKSAMVAARSPALADSSPAPAAGPAMMGGMMGMAGQAQAKSEAAPPTAAAPAGVTRKVIYDATLDLAVDKVDPVASKVVALVGSSGGYIAEENMSGSPGANRALFWRLRIPVDRFDGFVEAVKALGELEQFNRKSQDVTAEFYDIEAHVKNKKVQELTLQKILEERSGQLEEVLKVEVELSRVRGEIEQLQGRMRVLEALSSLATLTLTLRERDRFEPPAPVVADFPTQVARTWHASITQLVDVGKGLILFAVANAVWAPFWIVGLLVAWIGVRRLIARLRPLLVPARPVPPSV